MIQNLDWTLVGKSLTLVSYVLLAGFTAWLLAHVLAVARGLPRPAGRRWVAQADQLCDRLSGLIGSLRDWAELLANGGVKRRKEFKNASRHVAQVLKEAPRSSAIGWLEGQHGCDHELIQTITNCLRDHKPMRAVREEASSTVGLNFASWPSHLNMVRIGAPAAGVAGTVSSMMSFVAAADVNQQAGLAALLAPLSHAFLTTWIGLILAIAATALGLLVRARARRDCSALMESVRRVLRELSQFRTAHRRWQYARHRAEAKLEWLSSPPSFHATNQSQPVTSANDHVLNPTPLPKEA